MRKITKLTDTQLKDLALRGINFMSEMNTKHPEAEIRIMVYKDGISVMWQGVYSAAFGVSKYHYPMSESLENLNKACDLRGWEPRFDLPDWAK